MNGPILPGETLATVRAVPTHTTAPQTMATSTAQPIRRCNVALNNRDGSQSIALAPAAWLGQFIAVTPPAGADHSFTVQRGLWVITHRGCGLAFAHLRCSKKDAIALAKAWDQRCGTVDPANARTWPHCEAWGRAVAKINRPSETTRWGSVPAGDDGTGTAGELAAAAGIPIDQAGGVLRIQWRGKFWPAPSDAELELWTFDSCCETPDGRTVEPDHPESWLRILRIV
jgi:hypothetical protein